MSKYFGPKSLYLAAALSLGFQACAMLNPQSQVESIRPELAVPRAELPRLASGLPQGYENWPIRWKDYDHSSNTIIKHYKTGEGAGQEAVREFYVVKTLFGMLAPFIIKGHSRNTAETPENSPLEIYIDQIAAQKRIHTLSEAQRLKAYNLGIESCGACHPIISQPKTPI